jgi:hypothetical protein
MSTHHISKSEIQVPVITSFSPNLGPVGTLITIVGTDLQNTSELSIGGTAAIIVSNTSTQIVGMVMPGADTSPISLKAGGTTATSSGSFEPIGVPAPSIQQGPKLVGTGTSGNSNQGIVAVSADGNTAAVGGSNDNFGVGSVWIFTRSAGVWSQQGSKLEGSDCITASGLGTSVAISADGNTVIAGGPGDNSLVGAAWIFTRANGVWSQQGSKLVGSAYVGGSMQGSAVAISADGNTAVVGGNGDNNAVGATWVFTRSGSAWTQQGGKLVGTGFSGNANQGLSLAMSADGKTIIVGSGIVAAAANAPIWVFINAGGWQQQGNYLTGSGSINNSNGQNTSVAASADGNTFVLGENQDNGQAGAAWIFTRTGAVWSQQGNKLIGTGAVGNSAQGVSVSISADGNTAVVGGNTDNGNAGAIWVYRRAAGSWTQSGNKLVGTGASGNAFQGNSVALSADGCTALSGGFGDSGLVGASWVFVSPSIA